MKRTIVMALIVVLILLFFGYGTGRSSEKGEQGSLPSFTVEPTSGEPVLVASVERSRACLSVPLVSSVVAR